MQSEDEVLNKIIYSVPEKPPNCENFLVEGLCYLDLETDQAIILGNQCFHADCWFKYLSDDIIDKAHNIIKEKFKKEFNKILSSYNKFPELNGKHKIINIKLSPIMEKLNV